MALPSPNIPHQLLPPILIVDHDSAILHQALSDDFPNLRFDLCSTREEAEQNLRTKRYQALITNVRSNASQLTSLIHLNKSGQWTAPCIVTARRIQDMPLVQQAFKEGAFDCILKPVVRYQAVHTIQSALWLFQLRSNIEYRRHTLKVLKDQTEALSMVPAQKVDRISLIKDLITSHDRTLAAIEDSIELLTRTATEVEQKARERALTCLNELPPGL